MVDTDTPPGKLARSTKILIGLCIGAAAGTAVNLATSGGSLPDLRTAADAFANNVAKPVGDVFLNMLFMVVVPLVFSSLILGVAGIGDLKSLGRIGRRTLLWFFGTTALAVCVGLVLVNLLRPGETMDAETVAQIRAQYQGDAQARLAAAERGTGFSVQTFVDIVPRNVAKAATENSMMLGLIFFALLAGIAATQIERIKVQPLLSLLEAIYEISVKILGFAMALAPYGVAGLIFHSTFTLGVDVLKALGYYVVVAIGGLVLYQFLILGAIARVVVGQSPLRFFGRCRALFATAFSTSSSNATLPTTIRTAQDEFGVPPQIAGFVMPLGATMNMNGTALFEGVSVLFLAQVAGIELGLGQQAIVVATAVLTAIGAAGVPGGSLPLLAIVLGYVGVEPAMLGLILGVDRLVDMARTVPNVTSDLLCSLWIAKREGVELKT